MIQNGAILDGMYQIIGEIGRGGTGIIYLAEHLRLRKKVVVKKIKDNFVGQVNGRAEVDILKRLHHTCLPHVYDFLVIDSNIYTVMEYVEGNDLQLYIDKGYRFPESLLRKWFLDLCDVLEYIHGQNPPIFHSDIKPANLMVTAEGNICLIDFNISLDGQNTKELQGLSRWYAAPEQYEKAQNIRYGISDKIVLDGRMDIYSLGAVFYRLMTGVVPASGGQTVDIMEYDIPYSEGMKAMVSKAMRRNPRARFQTAHQMAKVARNISRMDPIYRQYEKMQFGALAIWFLCLIIGGMLLYYGNWQYGIERWQAAYSELYLVVESEDDAQTVSKATDMLNSFVYRGYLDKHPDKRAQLLQILGDSYYKQEQFSRAADCYEEAWQLMPQEGDYCLNYVIALVHDGQEAKAEDVVESAEGVKGLTEAEKLLIQAEISWKRDEYATALSQLDSLLNDGHIAVDADDLQRVYWLQADIYESLQKYGAAAESLEKARALSSEKKILRRLGQLYVKAASVGNNPTMGLNRALDCYSLLNQSNHPSYEDRLNFAIVKRSLGDFTGSNAILLRLFTSFPDEYVIPMWMCFNDLDIAQMKGSYDEVADDLKLRYQESKRLYDTLGEKNEDMEKLIDTMRQLEVQGL